MAQPEESLPAIGAAPARLLQVIASLDPSHGGPQENAAQICRGVRRVGGSADIVTLDAPSARWDVEGALVFRLGPGRLGNYAYSEKLVSWIHANAWHYDAVIVHGLWQYPGLATWRALADSTTPYFVFPHGMLDPWFKRQHPLKHLKKQLYWPWAEYRVLRDASGVLFMCEEERRLARESFSRYRVNEVVIGCGISRPEGDAARQRDAFLQCFGELRGKRLLLFLGRVHPKKGCGELIEAFAHVASQDPSLHLVMVGPNSPEYVSALGRRARSAGVESRICWAGMLRDDLKWGAFHAAEAFVLPSHQENFGIAVAEALACGLPVLISDKVNIWREIDRAQAGVVADDSSEGAKALLQMWLGLSRAEQDRMRRQARACFEAHFHLDTMTGNLLSAIGATRCEPQRLHAA